MTNSQQFIKLAIRFNKLPSAQLDEVIRELYSEEPAAAKNLLNTLVKIGEENI